MIPGFVWLRTEKIKKENGVTQKRVTIQFINLLPDTAVERFGIKDVQYSKVDAIHDTVHEMARDEARYGKALKGLLDRYFK